MTTCTWNFRRHAGRVLVAAGLVALTFGLVSPRASADQVGSLRAQASALVAKITSLGQQEDALSEQYDAAQLQVQTLQSKVADASQMLASAQATAGKARSALEADAINAYINGGASPLTEGASAMQTANQSLLRAEYVNTLATNQSDAIDQYHLAALQEQAAETTLKQQTSQAQAQVRQVSQDESAVSGLQAQLESTYKQDTGQIATLVAQQEAAAAQAAAAAAQAQLAQTQSSAQLTSSGSFGPPPPVGSGAAGAVEAAESQVGVPYVWGGSSPRGSANPGFDCSGLVMWAYAQVGVSLPHYSGAQYADTTHIPMSDLEPGDLVFPSDPGQHVAMYVGNGMIVQAPYTGADVQVVPLSSFFVLASRVE